MDWTDIRGWFSDAEGAALQSLSAGRVVLELGCYAGRSTVCIAKVAQRVTAVDWFRGDADTGPADTLSLFLRNLELHGVIGRVDVLVSRFEAVDWTGFADQFDVCFFDGAHDPVSVERDARICLGCCRPGGVIAWHDDQMTGVRSGLAAAGLAATHRVETLGWTFKGVG